MFYKYESVENSLTRGLIFTLKEHKQFREKFFKKIGVDPSNDLKFQLQKESGKKESQNRAKSTLDAVVFSADFQIYIESKREQKISKEQLNNHIEGIEKKRGKKKILLLVSENKNDLINLKSDSKKVILEKLSWREIFNFGKDFLPKFELDKTSDYILNEFLRLLSDQFQFFLGYNKEDLKMLKEVKPVTHVLYKKTKNLGREIVDNLEGIEYLRPKNKDDLTGGLYIHFSSKVFLYEISFSENKFVAMLLATPIRDSSTCLSATRVVNILNKINSDKNFISKLNVMKGFKLVLVGDGDNSVESNKEIECEKIKSVSPLIRFVESGSLEQDCFEFSFQRSLSEDFLMKPTLAEKLSDMIKMIKSCEEFILKT